MTLEYVYIGKRTILRTYMYILESGPFWGPVNMYIILYICIYIIYIYIYIYIYIDILLSDCNICERIHFGNLFLGKWTWKSWNSAQNKHFSQNGSAGQTTMLTRRASKFWVKPRSPFSEISHHDPETIGKPRAWMSMFCLVIGVIWDLVYYLFIVIFYNSSANAIFFDGLFLI